MMGHTHSRGGEVAALAGFYVLAKNDMLVPGVHPLLQLAIIYPFALYGSKMPDMDHHWGSVPYRDLFNWMVWKVMHPFMPSITMKNGTKEQQKARSERARSGFKGKFRAKHRSAITHSDLTLATCLGLTWYFAAAPGSADDITGVQSALVALVGVGFSLGIAAHLFLDGITPEGIWSVPSVLINKAIGKKILPEKWRLVLKRSFFATGSKWEDFINRVLWVTTFLLAVAIIIELIPYDIQFNLGGK